MTREEIQDRLTTLYDGQEATNIAKFLLLDLFGKLSAFSDEELLEIESAVERLSKGEPLQYVTGKAHFLDLILSVGQEVLIPRPETEELAGMAINFIRKRMLGSVIDVGTGSGCIGLAIKKKLNEVNVFAVDYSKEALAIAQKNAKMHQLEVVFQQLDFLNKDQRKMLPAVDFIVSNPPYISLEEKKINAQKRSGL